MMTVTCRAFRVHGETDGRVTLEIDEPTPSDLLPRLIKQSEAAKRLAVSLNHLKKLAKQAGIRPVAGEPVRYRENDLLRLTLPTGEQQPVMPAIVSMPTPPAKTVAAIPTPSAITATASTQPRPRTKLRI